MEILRMPVYHGEAEAGIAKRISLLRRLKMDINSDTFQCTQGNPTPTDTTIIHIIRNISSPVSGKKKTQTMRFYTVLFLIVSLGQAQEKKSFVTFDDGFKIFEDSKLDSSSRMGGWKLVLSNGSVVPVSIIHSFQNSNGKYYRIFNRSIVTQKESDGTISLYRAVEYDLMAEINPQPNPFKTSKYFSKNDGPIIPINFDNMYDAVKDNEASKSYLDRYTWLNYLKYSAVVITVGCVSYDLPRYSGYNKKPTASFVSGATTVVIGLTSYYLQGLLMEKAVAEYNK